MSLEIKRIDAERYVCNQCGQEYDIRDALIAKGNTYFCSMKCVLAYEEAVCETPRDYWQNRK